MPDKPTIREQWQAYAKGACPDGCGRDLNRCCLHFHNIEGKTHVMKCTAMTFEAWAEWRIERLTYALKACETFVMRVELETYRELRDRALAAQPESR